MPDPASKVGGVGDVKLGNSRGTSTVDVDVENMTMLNRALRTLKLRSSVDVES